MEWISLIIINIRFSKQIVLNGMSNNIYDEKNWNHDEKHAQIIVYG
jgi:hypothetical protein